MKHYNIVALAGVLGVMAFTSSAMASPLRLSDSQLDGITAGTATISITDSAGALVGFVDASAMAGAIDRGPVQVSLGNGTALAIGQDPTTSISVSGSGDTVITKTFHNGSRLVSFSSGVGVAVSIAR